MPSTIVAMAARIAPQSGTFHSTTVVIGNEIAEYPHSSEARGGRMGVGMDRSAERATSADVLAGRTASSSDHGAVGVGAAHAIEHGYPPPARAWYAVALFYVACVLSFVDRQIMSYLVAPIRAQFAITDFEFSLVHGFAFVIFYSTFGVPIARLADRYNRRIIIAVGVALWSLMTIACGLAHSYAELFLARLGVGIGEAALTPAAISILADSFPRERRALPISIFSSGVHGGSSVANILGGLVVGYVMAGALAATPLLRSLAGWQAVFVIIGVPGLLLAPLMLTIREPQRQGRVAQANVSFRQALSYLNLHRLEYSSIIFGGAFSAMAGYGSFAWAPALFARKYGWAASAIGPVFGAVMLCCGTGGLLLGGWISGRLARAGHVAAPTEVMIVSMACAVLPAAALVAVPSPQWTLACLALMIMGLSTPIGLAQAAIQAITPNEMRAQFIALYLLAVALFGTAVGSSAVAALTDYFFRRDANVGSSMAIVSSVAAAMSALAFRSGLAAHRRAAAQRTQGDRS
jgi:MFS family permease